MNVTTLPEVFIFQRCKYYGLWPELQFGGTPPFRIEALKQSEFAAVEFQLWYRTYGNIQDLNKTASEISGDVIEFIELNHAIGFYVGENKYMTGKPGDSIGQAKLVKPKQGEIDVYLSCKKLNGKDIDIDRLFALVAPIMPTLVLQLSIVVGDIVLPIGQPGGMQRTGTETKSASSSACNIVLMDRPIVETSTLLTSLSHFVGISAKMTSAELLGIGIAARRIIAGKQEMDAVDRYCDFWESCEFLCKSLKGKPDHRLAKILGLATNKNETLLKTKIIGPLYDIRKDIVHNAIEDAGRLKRAIPILEDISLIVFGYRLGIHRKVFLGPLADYYEAINSNTAIPI